MVYNLIQSSCVNVKIAGGREPRLVLMLFISFNEKITFLLVGTVYKLTWEVEHYLKGLFQGITYLKGGILKGQIKALHVLWILKNTSTEGHVFAAQGVSKGDLAA